MKTGINKIAILNTSAKIRTLKGQTKTNRKGTEDPRRFKNHLQPKQLNMVPVAFWNIYKRHKIVLAWLDEGILVVGKDAETEQKRADAVTPEKPDAGKAAEKAALAQLNSEGAGDEDEDEEDPNE